MTPEVENTQSIKSIGKGSNPFPPKTNMMFDNEAEIFQFMRNYGSSVGKEFSRSTKFLKGSKKLDSATFFCRGKRSF